MLHNAEAILVIIVSVTLTVFLVAAIVVLVLISKLIKSVRRMVEHAEQVVETAGTAAEMMRNASGPLALFKVLRNVMKTVESKRKS
jgi:CHASE3 domain sensor protein